MGLGGISIWQLLIVLLIVVLLFGTKKLKSLGEDLGGAVKGFKKGLGEDEETDDAQDPAALNQARRDASGTDSTTRRGSDSEKAETRP